MKEISKKLSLKKVIHEWSYNLGGLSERTLERTDVEKFTSVSIKFFNASRLLSKQRYLKWKRMASTGRMG